MIDIECDIEAEVTDSISKHNGDVVEVLEEVEAAIIDLEDIINNPESGSDEKETAHADLSLINRIKSDLEEVSNEQLIDDDDDAFSDHAYEMARDVHGFDPSQWPFSCIDWGRAANELRGDYSSIQIAGKDYLYR